MIFFTERDTIRKRWLLCAILLSTYSGGCCIIFRFIVFCPLACAAAGSKLAGSKLAGSVRLTPPNSWCVGSADVVHVWGSSRVPNEDVWLLMQTATRLPLCRNAYDFSFPHLSLVFPSSSRKVSLNFNICWPFLPPMALWFLHFGLVSFSLPLLHTHAHSMLSLWAWSFVVCTCELRIMVKGKSHILHINEPAAAIIAILRKATLTCSSSFFFYSSFFHIMKWFHLFLLPTSHLFCKQIFHTTSVSFLLSVILLYVFVSLGLSAQTYLLTPHCCPLTSFLVWYYCFPSHPSSLTLVLSSCVS